MRAVRANIERLHAQRPDDAVVVVADKGAHTGVLVQVIDQVRQGGVQNVSIAASDARRLERSHASTRHAAAESEETGIDLAPMLDFVLNLLIFFIITTSFVKEAGITVNAAGGADRRAARTPATS